MYIDTAGRKEEKRKKRPFLVQSFTRTERKRETTTKRKKTKENKRKGN